MKVRFRDKIVESKFLNWLKENLDMPIDCSFDEVIYIIGEGGEPKDFDYILISGYKQNRAVFGTKSGGMLIFEDDDIDISGEFKAFFENYTKEQLRGIRLGPNNYEEVIEKLNKDVVIIE